MQKKYAMIEDISFLNSKIKTTDEIINLYNSGFFENQEKWDDFKLDDEIPGLKDNIKSRMKYFMSILSLGVYNVLEIGPGKNISNNDEIYLFSGFTEIGTVSTIGDIIMSNNYSMNPSIFPNSVHHISLCYYTMLKKYTNYCAAITDGMMTNFSFINFIKYRIKLKEEFIIVSGEQNASFFDYDEDERLNIKPSFTAFKVKPNKENGFVFGGIMNSLEELLNSSDFKNSDYIFTDKITFRELKNHSSKKILCENILSNDNPCGVIYRLALPFVINFSGNSIVIDKIEDKYYYFNVIL